MRVILYPDGDKIGQDVTRERRCSIHLGSSTCQTLFTQTAWSKTGSYVEASKDPSVVQWLPEFCPPHERVALRNNQPPRKSA